VTELQPLSDGRFWYDVPPEEAANIELAPETAPRTSMGTHCPWPWEPQQLGGAPLGQYHCGYCGEMVVAGIRHLDYRGLDDADPCGNAADTL